MNALPVETLAALASGLGEESRIIRKLSGQVLTTTQMLLAGIFDGINMLCWLNSDDGRKGVNRPVSVLEKINGTTKQKEIREFDSGEDFEKERKRILAEVN